MERLICACCMQEVTRSVTHGLWCQPGGPNCNASPTGKHILMPNPPRCIYCGENCNVDSSQRLWADAPLGPNCPGSPNQKHALMR